MNKLTEEGLVYKLSSASATLPELKSLKNKDSETAVKVQGFMMYDYNQTQTLNNFYVEDTSLTGVTLEEGYCFAPIVTNVARWDTNDDGIKSTDEIMRFTESWRSVKSNGWVVNAKVANDEAKLNKVLEMIDFMYSEEGQILMTYGPMAKIQAAKAASGIAKRLPLLRSQQANTSHIVALSMQALLTKTAILLH
jgi:hypothetical protein